LWAFSCAGAEQRSEAEAETALPFNSLTDARFVADAGAGKIELRCTGLGKDTAAAILQARKTCLFWTALKRLASTPREKESLRQNAAKLLGRVDELVKSPPRASMRGRGGVMSKIRMSDNEVKVQLAAVVNEARARRILEEWGVLSLTRLAGGRRLVCTFSTGGSKKKGMARIAQDIVMTRLQHLPLDWIDTPPAKAGGKEKTSPLPAVYDLIFDLSVQEKKGDQSIFYEVALRVKKTKGNEIIASKSAQSSRYSGQPGESARAMQEALTDAVSGLVPQLRRALMNWAE